MVMRFRILVLLTPRFLLVMNRHLGRQPVKGEGVGGGKHAFGRRTDQGVMVAGGQTQLFFHRRWRQGLVYKHGYTLSVSRDR